MASIPNLEKNKTARRLVRRAIVERTAPSPRRAGSYAAPTGLNGKKASVEPLTLFGRIGRLLGARIVSEADLVKIVGEGLPASALDRLIEEIDIDIRLVGPETTVRRRMQEQQRFTPAESERLVRLARIASMAEELFGDTKAASAWLSSRSNYLSDADPISPLELSATDSGARMVEAMMLGTAHGVF